MPILKSYILPHGSNILDPQNFPAYPDCQTLHSNALKVGQMLVEDEPELIFLVTPHGHALSDSYCFYENIAGTGNVDDSKQYNNYTASVEIDVKNTQALRTHLGKAFKKKNSSFQGLVSYGDSMEIPLKWAEVIPLWFMAQAKKNKENNPNKKKEQNIPKFIILSLPHKRLQQGDVMTDDAYKIGTLAYEFLNNLKEKVTVLISCDLAHTHKIQGGPEAGTEPYGVSIWAEPFDEAVEKWARMPVEKLGMKSLLIDAREMLMKALSCGYLGLVILCAVLKTHCNCGGEVVSEVLCRLHPTYFGMMVARVDLK